MASDKKNKDQPQTKADIARIIGQTLQKKRQEKKISIEEVSAHLKIRSAFLQSLEKAEWNDLPGGVYLKSFLKKYALYLGVDADALVDPYFKEVKKEIREKEIIEEESTEQSDSNVRAWWISASVGAILLLGFIKFITHEPDTQSPAASIERPVVETAPAPAPENVAEAPQPVEHDISVFTPTPLWIRIDAENRTFEGFIPISSTWSWTGAGTFLIRLGHTKEVTLLFDGEAIPLGENQKRVTLPNES